MTQIFADFFCGRLRNLRIFDRALCHRRTIMPRHLVVAPQPGYEGKTLGVMFHNSQAVVDEHSVDAKLGRTPAEVIETFKKDFPAYTVEPLGGPSASSGVAVTVPEMPWRKSAVRSRKSEVGSPQSEVKPKAKSRRETAKPKA
jgi:hypothetical protein